MKNLSLNFRNFIYSFIRVFSDTNVTPRDQWRVFSSIVAIIWIAILISQLPSK